MSTPSSSLPLTEQVRHTVDERGIATITLDRPDVLRPVVTALGARHLGYGAKMDQFGLVGVALLDTLARTLGDAFDFRAMEAWGAAWSSAQTACRHRSLGSGSAR